VLKFSNWKVDNLSKLHSRAEADLLNSNYLVSLKKAKSSLPSLTAVYRVKNGQEYLEASILSIAPIATEIVVVDNNSSDKTVEIVKRLKAELAHCCQINLYDYCEKLELAGEGYGARVKQNPQGSLANYYKFAFSNATSDYLLKMDAHYIFLPRSLKLIQDHLSHKPDYICYRGKEIFGRRMAIERYIFKNSNYDFVDGKLFEELTFPTKPRSRRKIKTPLFIHAKRLSFVKYAGLSANPIEEKYR
jgi:glycosyltransferase involved in cell wall biosynthesis